MLRDLLGRRARVDFDEAFGSEDRLTQAVTIFALLEMHKKGEATWTPARDVRPDRDPGRRGAEGGRRMSSASDLARTIEALLFLSPEPVPVPELIEACEVGEVQVRNALDVLAEELAPGRRGLVLKEVGGGYTLATDPDAELAGPAAALAPEDAAADPGTGGDAGDRRLPAAGLTPRDLADPRGQLRVGGHLADASAA